MRKHNKKGRFEFSIADDCTVVSEGTSGGGGGSYYGGDSDSSGSSHLQLMAMSLVSSVAIVAMNI